ncbi:hypothetical protein PHMEG_00040525, partial [Phytophthora megakarya]
IMKVFLADGFVLDQAAVDYRDHVLELGKRAETAILTYLKAEHKINSRGSSAVLKHRQGLHSTSPPAASPDSGNQGPGSWLHARRPGSS